MIGGRSTILNAYCWAMAQGNTNCPSYLSMIEVGCQDKRIQNKVDGDLSSLQRESTFVFMSKVAKLFLVVWKVHGFLFSSSLIT